MKIFLVSDSFISIRDANWVKLGSEIDENNSFLDNLKRLIPKYDNMVFICNYPNDYEDNDENANFLAKAFSQQLTAFKNVTVLDNRTKHNAKEIILNADFVYLQGGLIDEQNTFIKQINLAENLKQSNAVVVGKSAGAMNLCEVVYNYPETDDAILNPKWYTGLGLCDYVIIPHFERESGNAYVHASFHVLNDYYIPDSFTHKFHAIVNGAYILIEDNMATAYGETYVIENGQVLQICKNGEKLKLK